jgi:chromate transporter
VVGVVLNLSIWFALHVIFDVVNKMHVGLLHLSVAEWSTLNISALELSVLAFILLFACTEACFKRSGFVQS